MKHPVTTAGFDIEITDNHNRPDFYDPNCITKSRYDEATRWIDLTYNIHAMELLDERMYYTARGQCDRGLSGLQILCHP